MAIDGQLVDDSNAFDYRFATKPLGGRAQLGVLRGGKRDEARGRARDRAERRARRSLIRARSPFMGSKVANISPALADELRLDAVAEGVVILEVGDGSLAQNFGFQRGDRIVAVNNEKIARTRDLDRIAKDSSTRLWRITIERGGKQMSVQLGG